MRRVNGSVVRAMSVGSLAMAAALGLGPEAAGQAGLCQLDKLLAADGVANDIFGTSVSVSGDVAVVGAILDDDNGTSSGSAYIYRFNGTTWVQEQKLLADDGAAGDRFGISVSVSGAPGSEVAVVGAHFDDDNGSESGSAYIYRFNGAMWVQEQKLLASDGAANHVFGHSVSVSGAPGSEVAVVGANGDDDNGTSSGSAYIYRFNGAMWVQEQKLLADDGAQFEGFGFSVAVSGAPGSEVVVVGADGDDDNGSSSGSAYIFRFNGAMWVQEQKLTASDAAQFDLFGTSVSISGAPGSEVAVVGANQDDDNGLDSGSAYVYRFDGAMWVQEQKLLADDGAANDLFGTSVSISGAPGAEVAVVGAYQDDDNGINSGSAYIYRFNGATWAQEQKLLAFDGAVSDHFGKSVSVSSAPGAEVAVVGASLDDDNGTDFGSAHIGDLRTFRLCTDCNANGVADFLDLVNGADIDCNDNLIPDACDIAGGFSMDADVNGIPDECEVSACPGDINGDGVTDVTDLLTLLAAWGACP